MRFQLFNILVPILLLCLFSCNKKASTVKVKEKVIVPANTLFEKKFDASLNLGEALLPFKLILVLDGNKRIDKIKVKNGNEVIEVIEISHIKDSVSFKMPLFDNEFKGIYKNDQLTGNWFNFAKGKDYKLPLLAKPFQTLPYKKPNINLTGKWQTTFKKGTENEYSAIAEFEQKANIITGTFLTETGDYRFLSGKISNNKFYVSAFDGAHAFHFEGELTDSIINGMFYSGNHYQADFVAVRDDAATLRNANTLTFLKDGYDKIEFTFKNENGDSISLSDERYQNKVVIVQILGTWCPNCMDESRLYADLYKQHKANGLEIIGLAFETNKEEAKVVQNLKRYKQQMGINYEILWAGKASKKYAAEVLPMLNHVMSFPTSIFIDKNGEVKRIHTGFNGPATSKYEAYVSELEEFLGELMK